MVSKWDRLRGGGNALGVWDGNPIKLDCDDHCTTRNVIISFYHFIILSFHSFYHWIIKKNHTSSTSLTLQSELNSDCPSQVTFSRHPVNGNAYESSPWPNFLPFSVTAFTAIVCANSYQSLLQNVKPWESKTSLSLPLYICYCCFSIPLVVALASWSLGLGTLKISHF